MILDSYDAKANRKNQKKKLIENEQEFYDTPSESSPQEKNIEMVPVGSDTTKNGAYTQEINGAQIIDDNNYARDEIFDQQRSKLHCLRKKCPRINRKCLIISALIVIVVIFLIVGLILLIKSKAQK